MSRKGMTALLTSLIVMLVLQLGVEAKSCGPDCDTRCLAEEGADVTNGVRNSDCGACQDPSITWWPCSTGKCYCEELEESADQGAVVTEEEGSSSSPDDVQPNTASLEELTGEAADQDSSSSPDPAAAEPSTDSLQELISGADPADQDPSSSSPDPADQGAAETLLAATTPSSGCRAKRNAYRAGVKDEDCSRCLTGYKFWPCQTGQCSSECFGDDASTAEAAEAAETASTTADAAPASPVLCLPGQELSDDGLSCVDSILDTNAGAAAEDFEGESVADWGQCGGLGLLENCQKDGVCRRCSNPAFECVKGNDWYYQCKPKEEAPATAETAAVAAAPDQVTVVAPTEGLEAGGEADEEAEAEQVAEAETEAQVVTPVAEDCDQGNIGDIITEDDWEDLFPYRNDPACKSNKNADGSEIEGGFYEYDKFVSAAKRFPCFLGQGDESTRKKEAAAFLAQISHETTGGWSTAPGGAQSWGLCWKEEVGCEDAVSCAQYCAAGDPCLAAGEELNCPCTAGKTYHGRGPMQLSWNYNYAPAGDALGVDLLNNPELITQDPELAFSTGIYFWMQPRGSIPSAHSVMTGSWTPTQADIAAGRTASNFGTTTNIINGGLECGIPNDYRVEDRVLYFERYAEIFEVDPGTGLRCEDQGSFG
ncbi:chitinase [Chloropicon primus]|nr:chitinase [Chloropicon primus]